MERAISFVRTHPVSTGFTIAILIGLCAAAVAAMLMSRAGLSLRPLVFLVGFFAIIIVPQWIYQVLREQGLAPNLVWTPGNDAPARVENPPAFAHADGKFLHPEKVFGPGFDPSLLADVRRIFQGPTPTVAQMAVFPNAETTVAARFADRTQAEQALRYYAAISGLGKLPRPNASGTYSVNRASDVARLGLVGSTLFVWTGASAEALDRRQSASSATWVSAAAAPADPRIAQWWRAMLIALPILVVAASLWFFKMSTWAATIPRVEQPWSAAASELRSKLLALASSDNRVLVTSGEQSDEVVVTWRDDATWAGPANVHRHVRAHKILLQLDDVTKTARITEFSRRMDASAGANGIAMNWRAERGVVFFQAASEKVIGLQLRSEPPTTGDSRISHRYRFNLQELKAPVITAVVRSGWTWKPVIWNGPAWLRWVTE